MRDVQPLMTAEDVRLHAGAGAGSYALFGNGRDGKPGINLHNAAYDFNDDILGLGASFWDTLVRRWLDEEVPPL